MWPTYPVQLPDMPEELIRHNENDLKINRKPFLVAADVWRDGVHLYRSYDLEQSHDLRDWVLEHFGTVGNYDVGMWAAFGVKVEDFPIPSMEALRPIGTAEQLRDLICSLLAIGDYPSPPPAEFDMVKSSQTISSRILRRPMPVKVMQWSHNGVTVRVAAIRDKDGMTQQEVVEDVDWIATLSRVAEVRPIAKDVELPAGSWVFKAPAESKPNHIARVAKAAAGVTGWQATKKPGQLEWRLGGAPYVLTVKQADG